MHPMTEALLRWYDENAREMPWRGIRDPYGIWVSEIMLQQTRVDTVRDYYVRFMARFPTVRALAEAPEEDVLKMWEGLGYYSRARNLREGAGQVMAEYGGTLPGTPEELRKIRGIGPYTSCSVASIAFGVPVPAVDGNVIRVICRLHNLDFNPAEPKNRARIEELARELVPAERPGDHNQAMMDLGATVCVPGTPDCGRCPLAENCAGRRAGTAEGLPKMPEARPPKEMDYDVPVITAEGCALMRQRTEKMLQGLWCFPLLEGHREEAELRETLERKLGIRAGTITPEGSARHVFTHRVWRMNLYRAEAGEKTPAPEGYAWIPTGEIGGMPMPAAMNAARRLLPENEGKPEAGSSRG